MIPLTVFVEDDQYDRVVAALSAVVDEGPFSPSHQKALDAIALFITRKVQHFDHREILDGAGFIPPGVVAPPEWVQPQPGLPGGEGYPAGFIVTHEGKLWRNTHGGGNVWVPGEFGWEEI